MPQEIGRNDAAAGAKRRKGRAAREEVAGGPSGSLSRGLEIVDVLLRASASLTLSDIANEAGLDASTAYRLLQTLADYGYVVRDAASKRYLPGPRALSPLSLFHPLTQLRREAAPVLQMLRESTGETTGLVLFLGQERLVVDFARGNHPLSPYYDTWLKSPLHGSASGKLLLAALPESERERLLGPGPYPAHTPATITDPAELRANLEQIRRQGYVVARDDTLVGLTAIAAPLVDSDGRVLGCLVVTATSQSITPKREHDIAVSLKGAAALLMNSAPSLQVLRYWTVRSTGRRPAAVGFDD